MLKKILKFGGIILLVLVIVLTIVAGVMGGIGPFGFIFDNKIKALPGNAEEYHLANISANQANVLNGKTIYFLGSSVTKGEHSLDVSFADYIAKLDSVNIVKEAVSWTKLVDTSNSSYISRMEDNIPVGTKMDLLVVQLSTNDATWKEDLGEISTSTFKEDFDTKTIIGAIEYIIVYAEDAYNCPVIFYTGTKYDSELYGQMVSELNKLQDKYEVGVIDLWNNVQMNQVSATDYKLYMSDKIHPTQAGYLLWWTPVIEEYLYSYFE